MFQVFSFSGVQVSVTRFYILLLFGNSHLLLLFCVLQMTNRGNGLWRMIINAAGLLTKEQHSRLFCKEKEHQVMLCSLHYIHHMPFCAVLYIPEALASIPFYFLFMFKLSCLIQRRVQSSNSAVKVYVICYLNT